MLRLRRASTWPKQIIDGEGPLLTTESSGTDGDRSHILGPTATVDRDEQRHTPASEQPSQSRHISQAFPTEEDDNQGDGSLLLHLSSAASVDGAHHMSKPVDELQRDGDSLTGPSSLHATLNITFEAILPPPGYPTLDYLPTILTPKVTTACIIFYLSFLTGMVLLRVYTDTTSPYIVHNVNLYLAARYGPLFTAIITTTVFKTTVQEFRRMLPYLNMADRRGQVTRISGSASVAASYWPLLNQSNSPITWVLAFIVPVTTALIGFKALLVQILDQGHAWAIIVHSGVALFLVVYYAVITCFTAYIMAWVWVQDTGLRQGWDPASLADMLALFHWCDLDAAQTRELRLRSQRRALAIWAYKSRIIFRLGYWRCTEDGTAKVVYGIRVLQSHAEHSSRHQQRPVRYLYKHSPLLHWTWLLLYITMATALLCLLIYVACAGFLVNGFHLHHGIFPHVLPHISRREDLTISGSTTWIQWFSSPQADELLLMSLILRALPITVMAMALGYCTNLDAHHRYLQPFLNMTRRACKAEDSILLKYLTMSPLDVTQIAFAHGHWKVFYYSILAAVKDTLVIIPWSVLALTSTESGIVGHFSPTAYGATCLILAGFIPSCLFAWPRDARKLPRQGTTLLDIWAMCHESHLATLPEFGICTPTWTQQDLMATIQLWQDRYSLGICHGPDGKDHLGFDIVTQGRICEDTGYVTRVKPKNFWRWSPWRMWRHQRLQKQSNIEMEEGSFVRDAAAVG